MHQPGVIALAKKIEQVHCRINVRGESIAQVGIEIGQSRAVGDDVDRTLQARLHFRGEAQTRLADIPFDNIHFFLQEVGKFGPWISWRVSNVGDSSTIFSKRRCAGVVRLRRIRSVTL